MSEEVSVSDTLPGLSRELTIQNRLGLHARASATLVRVATQFKAEITLSRDDQSVNAKSILGMMTLAAAQGTRVRVTCVGADEAAALEAVAACINNKFGED
jgi:phosphocarrier protein HPr